MRRLELLAPARNADIGIAAIGCGADAVYIAGPRFGARKDAGNSLEEVGRLCDYARRFGVKVYMTVNILLSEDEMDEVHGTMLRAQELGVSAFIIRDTGICAWKDITVPMHASTQCAIRTPQRAVELVGAGCSRVIVERELTLDGIKDICSALEPVSGEVECFVHGALCVCYSGLCTMSQALTGRSADRGECIQACRNLYDLEDSSGRVLVHSKALLSLKDLNLIGRVEDLARAGAVSFKIEGRLKNESYVRNVVYAYSKALDALVASAPGQYCRASFGRTLGGFTPDLDRTFNRGYADILGSVTGWAGFDTPKGMGEKVGRAGSVRTLPGGRMEIVLDSPVRLSNGDGFAFADGARIVGFRGDVCAGPVIRCKSVEGLKAGVWIYRNLSVEFERQLLANPPRRALAVNLDLKVDGFSLLAVARCENGLASTATLPFTDFFRDRDRAVATYRQQLEKSAECYDFRLGVLPEGPLPFLRISELNALRRSLASNLEPPQVRERRSAPKTSPAPVVVAEEGELMRTRYCLRRELGWCLKEGKGPKDELFLVNNGRRFPLEFDCRDCEMKVKVCYLCDK